EIESQMSDLREQFKQESLPIDDDLLTFDLDETTQTAHANYPFVRQLEIAAAGKRRIAAAIRDYYRAFEQRSRWIRNDLLLVGNEFEIAINRSYLHTILKNTFYIGYFVWGGKTYKGTHETFISPTLFESVQSILKGHNKPKYRKNDIAFRGLLR